MWSVLGKTGPPNVQNWSAIFFLYRMRTPREPIHHKPILYETRHKRAVSPQRFTAAAAAADVRHRAPTVTAITSDPYYRELQYSAADDADEAVSGVVNLDDTGSAGRDEGIIEVDDTSEDAALSLFRSTTPGTAGDNAGHYLRGVRVRSGVMR